MFDARAVLGIVLYFKEKVLKPLRKDGYLNRCNLPKKFLGIFRGYFFGMKLFYNADQRTGALWRKRSFIICLSENDKNLLHIRILVVFRIALRSDLVHRRAR